MPELTQKELDEWLNMDLAEIADMFADLKTHSLAPPASIRLLILLNLVKRVAALEKKDE